jgi:uncharacterized protein (DUF488 family)
VKTRPAKRRTAPGWGGARVLALGHSTRSREELIALLVSNGVKTLADVRKFPRSGTNPQFDEAVLARALPRAGVGYVHVPELGGRRKGRADSKNGAWRNASFRAYADHLATDEFRAGLELIRLLAREGPVAVMCAEALPWRCHRSLLADALFAKGVVVEHIEGEGRTRPHAPPPFAVFAGTQVTYPGDA